MRGLERRLARPRKLATIADIRDQLNRDDTGVDSPPLSDEEAMKLFDRACTPTYAQGFRLYVIYARAAGFGPLLRQIAGLRRRRCVARVGRVGARSS